MSEQTSEQTQESKAKSIAEMSSEELKAEMARVDSEIDELSAASVAVSSDSGPSFSWGEARPTSPQDIADLQRRATATRNNLVRQYESLASDEKYVDSYRAEQAWRAYDKAKPSIEADARSAREGLLKRAEHLEKLSVPFPAGQQLRTDKTEHLALTQGERTRIVERLDRKHPAIERLEQKGKNAPSSPKPQDILAKEYAQMA